MGLKKEGEFIKLWKAPHMMENYDPEQKGQKGWNVYCRIGKRTMMSWFTSPSKDMVADKKYLSERGYHKITTDKRAEEFKRLWKILFKSE